MDGKRLGAAHRPPIPVREPNAATFKAMKELDEGKGKRFASLEELFEDIGVSGSSALSALSTRY